VRQAARSLRQQVEGLRAFGVTAVPTEPGAPRTARGGEGSATAGGRPVPAARAAAAPTAKAAQLEALARAVSSCRRCPLYRTRTHTVVSDGSPEARLVFVGEAPGRDEDLQGRPFVGAAGQLLTKMIEAMGLRRGDVYICNVLKDRPPANRTPLPEEVEACRPFLEEQLAIVRPRVICVLGAVAAKALLGPQVAITRLRGTVCDYRGTPVVPTFHPAYLLRNPPAKKLAWIDLKLVKKLLAEA
jgi:DNA polymerase